MPWTFYFVFLLIFQTSCALRRIRQGYEVENDKKYAVYLLKDPSATVKYRGWTCGGAIVSPSYVVTSAACVEDVQHMYAIAGYKNYVSSSKIDDDECTKIMKKKVVYICVPTEYQLDFHKTETWARIDIAVIKVESPFKFNDTLLEHCSYTPQPIEINYESLYQEPGVDAIVLGWGHLERYRADGDETNLNQATLHYAQTRILDKKTCNMFFENSPELKVAINKYMICTLQAGSLNDKGEILVKSEPIDGCVTELEKHRGAPGVVCLRSGNLPDETRKQANVMKYYETKQLHANKTRKQIEIHDKRNQYTPGICQNDHGGPLITWVGRHEVLIGVATLYKLDEDLNCIGPYLFTSTQCNGAFLSCILSMEDDHAKRRCVNPEEVAAKMIARRISWLEHVDGPAENEIFERPQIPLSEYNADAE